MSGDDSERNPLPISGSVWEIILRHSRPERTDLARTINDG